MVTKIQPATFLHMAGTEALDNWKSDDNKSKVDKITEKFDEYSNPKRMSQGRDINLHKKLICKTSTNA